MGKAFMTSPKLVFSLPTNLIAGRLLLSRAYFLFGFARVISYQNSLKTGAIFELITNKSRPLHSGGGF